MLLEPKSLVENLFNEIEAGIYTSITTTTDEDYHFKHFYDIAENVKYQRVRTIGEVFKGLSRVVELLPCDTQWAYNNFGIYVINPDGKNDDAEGVILPQWIFVNTLTVYAMIGFQEKTSWAVGAVGQEKYESTEVKRMLNLALTVNDEGEEQLYQIISFPQLTKILNWLVSDIESLVEV